MDYPEFLAPYLEKENTSLWQFYIPEAEMPEDYNKQLHGLPYILIPDAWDGKVFGYTIRLYKSVEAKMGSEYHYIPNPSGLLKLQRGSRKV